MKITPHLAMPNIAKRRIFVCLVLPFAITTAVVRRFGIEMWSAAQLAYWDARDEIRRAKEWWQQ